MKIRPGRLLGLLSAALLGFPVASMGQPGPLAEIREALDKLDKDGDSTITRDEVPESGRAAFGRLLERVDRNKNGKMEIEERRELFQKLRPLAGPAAALDRFRAVDKDKNGKVSRAEFPGPDVQFARLDADRDGSVSEEEFLKGQANPPAEAAAPAPKPAAETDAAGPARRRQRILAMDKDKDGKVSRAEWQGQPQGFERLDANKDGFLTTDELPKGPSA